jgi:hypothetical protein
MGAKVRPVETERFERSAEAFEQIVEFAGSEEADEMTESDLEREFEKQVRDLKRQLLQDHLDRRQGGSAIGPVEDSEGRERNEVRAHERTLRTTFGEVSVARFGYGGEGLESLHPLDGALNLPPDGYSLELRRRVAREAARGSYEEAIEAIEETTGVIVPKRQAEELAARAAEDFDQFYADKQVLEALEQTEAPILVMSVDGKGIVMRHEDLREATRKKAARQEHKLTTRLSRGEKTNSKRMAAVATVYGVNRNVRTPEEIFPPPGPQRVAPPPRPRPVNKRVWASVEQEPEQVVEEMFLEAESRDLDHRCQWVAVVDGNEHQLNLIGAAAETRGVTLTTILDIIHVLEYIWKAGMALHGQGTSVLEEWVQERMLQILSGRAPLVAAGMRRSATRRSLPPAQRKAIDEAADYLLNHKQYLRYDDYLARGLPIASGVIEGACRHLVNIRMNRSGARWSVRGAEAILKLRSLVKSGDFDEYWKYHEARELERNHLQAYADRRLPQLYKPAARPTLRRVK